MRVERVRAPEGRKTGGEGRSAKNAIIKAGGREGRRRVRAPKKGKRKKKGLGERKQEFAGCHCPSLLVNPCSDLQVPPPRCPP